jgi:hypothetical protein
MTRHQSHAPFKRVERIGNLEYVPRMKLSERNVALASRLGAALLRTLYFLVIAIALGIMVIQILGGDPRAVLREAGVIATRLIGGPSGAAKP